VAASRGKGQNREVDWRVGGGLQRPWSVPQCYQWNFTAVGVEEGSRFEGVRGKDPGEVDLPKHQSLGTSSLRERKRLHQEGGGEVQKTRQLREIEGMTGRQVGRAGRRPGPIKSTGDNWRYRQS